MLFNNCLATPIKGVSHETRNIGGKLNEYHLEYHLKNSMPE